MFSVRNFTFFVVKRTIYNNLFPVRKRLILSFGGCWEGWGVAECMIRASCGSSRPMRHHLTIVVLAGKPHIDQSLFCGLKRCM